MRRRKRTTTILVVDDNPAERELALRRIGELASGARVVLAADPAEALDALDHHRVDLALVDYSLGAQMTGYELSERMEARGVTSYVVSNHVALERGASWIDKQHLRHQLPRLLEQANTHARSA